MVFVGKWMIFSIGLIAICQSMLYLGLLYGLKERKAGFLKFWLVVKFVEIILAFLISIFKLITLIYQSNESWTIIKGPLTLYSCIFLLNFMKTCACYLVLKVHKDMKKEDP